MKKSLFFLTLVIIFASCGGDKPENKKMYSLASSLTKLSSAVESTVRYKAKTIPSGISDKELLVLATKHDPKLLKPFNNYTVKVSQKNRHAIVLVCTKDGKRALLEDAGCSREMDKHLWKSSSSCRFRLKAKNICK